MACATTPPQPRQLRDLPRRARKTGRSPAARRLLRGLPQLRRRRSSTASSATPTSPRRRRQQPRIAWPAQPDAPGRERTSRAPPGRARHESTTAGAGSSLGVAALAGVALAPGITLFDLAQGRAAGRARVDKACAGACWSTSTSARPAATRASPPATRERLAGRKDAPTDAQWIRKVELKDIRGPARQSLPMMCQHCAHPPCVDVCPTGASFKRADGIVLVDRHICIGCRYCMMACPYKARSFVHEPVATRSPRCRAARAASSPARCACTGSTAAGSRPASRPAPRPATRRSCSATSTTRRARSRSAIARRSRRRRCAPTCGSIPACATRESDATTR